MRKQESKSSFGQFAAVVSVVREELAARGIGFIVIRTGGEETRGHQLEVFGVDSEAINAVLPPRLQRAIDAILKASSSEPAREYLIDVQAKITRLNLHLPQFGRAVPDLAAPEESV